MIRSFRTGLTYSLFFNFFSSSGSRTNVSQPVVDIFTPQKTRYITSAALTTTTLDGKYQYNFFAPSGLTVGHWFALGTGITNSDTIFSESNVFEIINIQTEAFWVGIEEFRDFLNIADDDREDDANLRQALRASIELVEGYTRRNYGIASFYELVEVKNTDRVKLKHFPIDSIVAITPTTKVIPRDVTNLFTETVTDTQVSFYYRLDKDNGIIYLTDSSGFDDYYDNMLIGISYLAGFATVPESVREAVLSLASAIHNLSCTQGLDDVKFADVSFTTAKKLFDGPIGEMLKPFINNCQV